MKKLTILVDMDDTIENLCEAWVAELNRRHGTHVVAANIREWEMARSFPELTVEQIYAPLTSEAFWHTVKPIDGAVSALSKLRDDGHRVVIVTASHHDTVSYKLNLVLFKYFPFLSYFDVIIASQKDLITGDVMIDDNPFNFDHTKASERLNILFTAPHNMNFDAEKAGFYRADTWKDVLTYVDFYSYLKTTM